MKLAWLSDIHLDHAAPAKVREFLDSIASSSVDGWLLGGDIGQADSVVVYLRHIDEAARAPVYFVLGNHDFYGGSIGAVCERVEKLARDSNRLQWLTASTPVFLDSGVALVGDDSWADARLGDPVGSQIELNDFYLIKELSRLSRSARIAALNRLGDEAAERLQRKIGEAASKARTVIVLLHVPPFREAAWHEGRPSADDWLPWFSCQAIGNVILAEAASHPDTEFLVLCGHAHGGGTHSAAKNVVVHTADAAYERPEIQRVFEFGRTE